jgi:hypothetical protein
VDAFHSGAAVEAGLAVEAMLDVIRFRAPISRAEMASRWQPSDELLELWMSGELNEHNLVVLEGIAREQRERAEREDRGGEGWEEHEGRDEGDEREEPEEPEERGYHSEEVEEQGGM